MALDRTRASLELLLSISRELASSLDLKSVLDRVLSLSITNADAERGSLIVLDENKNPVSAAIYFEGSPRPYTVKQLRDIVDKGLAGWVLQNNKPVLIQDTRTDKRWIERMDQASIRAKSAICVPVMARDRLVGILTMVHPKAGFFNEDNLALVKAIADMAGIAIFNAMLFQSQKMAVERYYELFEDSIYPILITDWNGRILEANRQAIQAIRFPLEILKTLSIKDLHGIGDAAFTEKLKDLKKGKTLTYETELKLQNLPALPMEFFVQKIDFQGVASLQWILRDISERKALDSMREDLIAMIYHDLRAPLSNIIASLDILGTMIPAEDTSTIRSVFQITYRSADRMQRLISSLLDINRLESGQPITNKKVVDLVELANEAYDAIQASMESKKQHLKINFTKKIPTTYVDEDMIRRVIINLLENASKFSNFEASLVMGGKVEGKMIYMWVDDEGPGIAENMNEIIFEKFTRINMEGAPKGFGLGLAFCKLAVEAHGGKIWVEDRSEKGSRFIFTLPILTKG